MKRKAEKCTCLCDNCPSRFECFTADKVFSNPDMQSLYELHCKEHGREQAIKKMVKFLEELIIPKQTPTMWWNPTTIGSSPNTFPIYPDTSYTNGNLTFGEQPHVIT